MYTGTDTFRFDSFMVVNAYPNVIALQHACHVPVIARSGLTGLSSARESRAVIMAQPADGPSLGVAPAGTCTWMAFVWKKSLPGFLRSRKARLKVCAMDALSFMTSPSCPEHTIAAVLLDQHAYADNRLSNTLR